MTRNRYKRRNYFIKKNFQGKLILGYFLFMVVGCLVFAVILTLLSADSMTMTYQNNDLRLGQTPFILIKELVTAHWIFIVLGSAIVVVCAMFITHRLAGPMFRLERAVDNMVSGQLDDVVYLREKDEGKELAAKLNQFNSQLSKNIGEIRKRSKNIDDLLAQYSSIEQSETTAEDCASIQSSIARQNKIIREIVVTYQILDE
ncbi:methyl-accepting chemotaxis protein [Desulfocapsa sulfexigens DSM 10523]|uniref:Methyl-accepting chemotaxis protein n=1 Tax=Desulfocapsa sulfexigens (strain DSM 10523 / SB164P1) TaxID=1167006 RepID=M1PF77_DESSD|nr:methyl-accepting chemotaxis protein [Desulfocapsa sulfexigens]AGF78345.1 methyl-accepting chemotaxis protein [Desulfocapsa sulfexigens DSM 10523]